MGSAKKTRRPPLLPSWVRGLAAYFWGPGRPWAIATGFVGGLALGTAAAHALYVYPHAVAAGQYAVTQEHVTITPRPAWIHADVRAEVFRDASLDGLSILDDSLAERIVHAFKLHPWVADAKAKKRPPAEVEVELLYRRPVCMVDQGGGSLPVDIEGVLLPSDDFSPLEKQSYPRLSGVDTAPMGPVGQHWGDGRVVGGAEIAAALAEAWGPLKLERIVPSPRAAATAGIEPTYQLVTRGGTRILWGLAPGSTAAAEVSATEKVARLRQYVAEHGAWEGRDGPQELDVRTLPAAKGAGSGA
jgi:hypothetical protein